MESIIASQKIGRRRRVTPKRTLQDASRRPSRGAVVAYQSVIAEQEVRGSRHGGASPRHGGASLRDEGASLRDEGANRRLRGTGLSLPHLGRRIPELFAHFGPSHIRARLRGPKLALAICIGLAAVAAIAVIVAVLVAGPAFPMPEGGLLPVEDSAQNLLLDYVSPELSNGKADSGDDSSPLPPAPATLELSTYTVRPGDSLATVAKRFGLNIDTIISANGISSSASVKPGIQLRIPNINGLVHKVQSGDSLGLIAKRYKIEATKIVDANDLGTYRLIVGQSLFIPGARLPDSAIKQVLGRKFAWPARGPLSSFFGYRPDPFTGVRRFHAGIDIAVDAGTTVRAAMDGKVADVGYNGNYGNYVILSHAGGFQTLYGHLTKYTVAVGETVSQGSPLGLSGNTGYSTGPHLHFGIFRRSAALNPLKYLK